jgi:hypothetical protein
VIIDLRTCEDESKINRNSVVTLKLGKEKKTELDKKSRKNRFDKKREKD